MSVNSDGPLMRDTFWKATNDETKWALCVLCIRAGVKEERATFTIPKNKGYGNFWSHLKSDKHNSVWPDLLNEARVEKDREKRRMIKGDDAAHAANETTLSPDRMSSFLVMKYGEKTLSVYGHLEYLIDSKTVHPWTFCEDPMWRKYSKFGSKNSLCAKSLKMWAHRVIDEMVKKITKLLPKTFGIIFDG